MLRAFFLAMGICCLILGVECLVVEKAEMASGSNSATAGFSLPSSSREIEPPEWAPWSLMSVGAVVILYTFTIPKKMTG
ncbi:MAG TPA: hypothetical protein VMF30_19080 [Pirellulales bacterium]|nr:hypothetical protein [Pirellulales bacterium]